MLKPINRSDEKARRKFVERLNRLPHLFFLNASKVGYIKSLLPCQQREGLSGNQLIELLESLRSRGLNAELPRGFLEDFAFDAGAHNVLGAYFMEGGEYKKSLRYFGLATILAPSQLIFGLNLAIALRRCAEFRLSITQFELLIEKFDWSDRLIDEFLTTLRMGAYRLRALRLIEKLGNQHYTDTVRRHHANLMLDRGDANSAKEILDAIAEKTADDRMLYAKAERNQGFLDSAIRSLNAASSQSNFENSAILLERTKLIRFEAFDRNAEQIKKLLNRAQRGELPDSAKSIINLHFALAKIFTDLEDSEQALNHYRVANGLLAEMDLSEVRAWRNIGDQVSREWCEAQLLADIQASQLSSSRPIFIVGMPRSGTTLLEQCLSNHPDIQGFGELPVLYGGLSRIPINREICLKRDFDEIEQLYMDELAFQGLKKPYFTDKQLFNILYVGWLSRMFPAAKFVYVERERQASNWSAFKILFESKQMRFSCDLKELDYVRSLFDRLADHWETLLAGKFFRVQYESLIDQPARTLMRLSQGLEITWDSSMMTPERNERVVSTASSLQVRRGISKEIADPVAKMIRYSI